MALIILIPAVICWTVLARKSVRSAFLDVYLPAVLLLPQYYILRLPHLPPITFSDAAMLPLGMALLLTQMRRWRFEWMDLWVLLFALSGGLSEGLSTQLANGEWVNLLSAQAAASHPLGVNLADGALMFIARVLSMVLPYMAGKLLIEDARTGDWMRRRFLHRVVTLLSVVALISVYDFVRGGSIWQTVGSHFFPTQYVGWIPQARWGFGRIEGPFGHAILAGMIFLMGLVYCLWLRRVEPDWGARRLFGRLPFTVRGLVLAGVVAGLLMTQSRGPWLGVALALVFAGLMRVLTVGRATVAFLLFLTLFGTAAYTIGNRYTDKDLSQASNEEQRNAIYRRELLVNYTPIVKQRKLFGWGITTYPNVNGQTSIDNQYLLLAVTQGFLGLGLFLAIVAGNAVRLLRMIARPLRHEDRLLVFAHLAVLIGLTTTLTTVYMGEQVVMLFFLFTGWVQAMRPMRMRVEAMNVLAQPAAFRRVLV